VPNVPVTPPRVLAEPDWRARQAAHEERVTAWTAGRQNRQVRGRRHPVEDFLWEYYWLRPGQLRQWHPGHGVVLAGDAAPWATHPAYGPVPGGVTTTLAALRRRLPVVAVVSAILRGTAARRPRYDCFGLHEWAMVYRVPAEALRHDGYPLRVSPATVVNLLQDVRPRCTHVDAYRFFAAEAVHLNTVHPTRASQADLEQPGCLHAGMDLYKWAFQLRPFVSSELVADSFEVARDLRHLDMRAAPYDLRALGFEPIRIETAQGRAEFAQQQQELTGRAASLRERLLTAVADLAESASATPGTPVPGGPDPAAGR